MPIQKYFALLLAVVVWPALATDETLDADTIVARANIAAYYQGNDGRAQVRMRILDAQGREQRRQFTVLRRDIEDGADQQFLVVFSQPADVRGTTFLVHKQVRDEDNRWLYLPGLDLVKRIAAGDKRTSFVGAHYYYEDVSGRRPNEDSHELTETTEEYYVLVHRPLDPASVEFAEYTTWIDRETFMPMRIEYRNAQGEAIRRVEVQATETIQGNATVTASRITDLASGGYTEMQFRNISYDLDVPEDLFGERSLRTPPGDWLRP